MQTVLLTGAARGIGYKIAEILVNKYNLILIDKNEIELENSATQLRHKNNMAQIQSYVCDVGSVKQVAQLHKNLLENNFMPHILINNAGYGGPFQNLCDISYEQWDLVMNTNLKSIFNFAKICLPSMQQAEWGRIINIASIQGLIGAKLSSTYIASKHGVIGYTKAIAAEYGQYSITCNAICPGYVDTAMGVQEDEIPNHFKNVITRTPLKQIGQPYDIAKLVEFLISDAAKFINGSIITIDGGLMADIGLT
ncbi:MAG: SDR family NAD(P)-dependent oxidoreductase [Burkholderiales bacterium]|nr:SDR family NAD(P)-dependent oxidoreductase [Burkholderiales bacterium]